MQILKSAVALMLVAACSPAAPDLTGAELFQANCAGCHGTDAMGGAAYGAPDLTRLAARNGGVFPARYVMSTIDGLERENTHDKMPIFGEILQSETEIWIDPNGVPTPTPGALIRLAAYLEGLQGKTTRP